MKHRGRFVVANANSVIRTKTRRQSIPIKHVKLSFQVFAQDWILEPLLLAQPNRDLNMSKWPYTCLIFHGMWFLIHALIATAIERWVIASYRLMWMELLIHGLISKLVQLITVGLAVPWQYNCKAFYSGTNIWFPPLSALFPYPW